MVQSVKILREFVFINLSHHNNSYKSISFFSIMGHICKYCKAPVLKEGAKGYCIGCDEAEKVECELRNFVLFISHRSEDEPENDLPLSITPNQLYECVETFMREVYE